MTFHFLFSRHLVRATGMWPQRRGYQFEQLLTQRDIFDSKRDLSYIGESGERGGFSIASVAVPTATTGCGICGRYNADNTSNTVCGVKER